jgi:V/A-type H+-transporting ATPase subunit I
MLIGDAAYGFIFMGMVFFAQKKWGKKMEDQTAFHLGYLLTGFTCFWGALTGTYFGQEWLPSSVKALVPWLNNSSNIQWLCFTIALIHLNIARLWTIKRKIPDMCALSEVGWLLIVWGMYFLANLFVLDKPFPTYAGWFFIVGILFALVFMFPFKDFFKKAPQELIPFVLNVIGAGTDIISYIRLFAVGLATVAVADAANFMPEALGLFVGGFFLVLLHIINMILAMMAILVHAVRLNVLEFSGHLGLEWAGIKYNPFHKSLKQA